MHSTASCSPTPTHLRPITSATSASKSTLSLASGRLTVAPGEASAFVNLAKKVGARGSSIFASAAWAR